jgi:hypothetical protein
MPVHTTTPPTPAAGEHRRTVRLPLGYRATFIFKPETGVLGCSWHPGIPRIESRRAWRKFVAAYQGERDAFLADVATRLGINILSADIAGGRITGSAVIRGRA